MNLRAADTLHLRQSVNQRDKWQFIISKKDQSQPHALCADEPLYQCADTTVSATTAMATAAAGGKLAAATAGHLD